MNSPSEDQMFNDVPPVETEDYDGLRAHRSSIAPTLICISQRDDKTSGGCVLTVSEAKVLREWLDKVIP